MSQQASRSRLWRALNVVTRGHRRALALSVGIGALATALSLGGVTTTARFVESLAVAADGAAVLGMDLPVVGLGILAVVALLVGGVFSSVAALVDERVSRRLHADLQLRVYRAAHRRVGLTRPTGEALHEITDLVPSCAQLPRLALLGPFSFAWQLVMATAWILAANVALGGFYLAAVAAIVLLGPRLLGIDRRLARAAHSVRAAGGHEFAMLEEQLGARETIRELDLLQAATERVSQAIESHSRARYDLAMAAQLRSLTDPCLAAVLPLSAILGLVCGADLSDLLVIWALHGSMRGALEGLVASWTAWKQVEPAVSVVMAQLEPEESGAPSGSKLRRLSTQAAWVRVRIDEARTPSGRRLLRGTTLTATPGRIHAVVGRGGSGKSVLLDVIADRFDGEVTGRVERPAECVRLPQTPQLLRTSVREWIGFGLERPLSREETVSILERVGLGRAEGARAVDLDAVIGRDFRPSGYQAQALRIAQLLPRRRPPVILFDEPDSSMNARDAAHLQAVIREEFASSVVILVTHAPESLLATDTILTIEASSSCRGASVA